MKTSLKILTVMSILTTSTFTFAGTGKFDSDAFNSIITESLQAESDLREQLRVNAGAPDLKKELNPDFAEKGKRLAGTIEAEDVAAPTSDYSVKKSDRQGRKLYEKSLKRLSQEIKDLERAE